MICTQQLTAAAGLGTGNKSEEGTIKFFFKDNIFHNKSYSGDIDGNMNSICN